MTKPGKVVLWGEDELLTRAMEMLLMDQQTEPWQVIRLAAHMGNASIVETIRRIMPDLVIIYQAKPYKDCDPLIKLLHEQPDLAVLADQPEARVIIVSLENNVVQVYSKHSITVRQVSDLLSVIEDRYFSENQSTRRSRTHEHSL